MTAPYPDRVMAAVLASTDRAIPHPRTPKEPSMAVDPNWKPDPEKVRAVLAEAEAEVAAQQLVVEKLRDLVDDEERELVRRQRRVEEMREAWARHGVEIPR